jgi:hypothetical protein
MPQTEMIRIPVLLIGRDSNGKRIYRVGEREVSKKERKEDLDTGQGEIIFEKIKQKNNRKIDQRVLATEIG